MRRMGEDAPLRSLLSTKGGGRSQISDAPASPQSGNLRVGPQLPLHTVTAGPEDDAGGAAGLEPNETFAQVLARACEGHLFGGGYVDERVMAVRNVEGMTAVIGERDERFDGGRGARRGDVLAIIENRAAGRHEAGLEPFGRRAQRNQAIG